MKLCNVFGLLGGGAVAALVLASMSDKVYAVSASAVVDARVLVTMTISTLRGLSFGVVATGLSSGVITVPPVGVATASGGILAVDTATAAAAAFQLQGQPNAAFTVQLPTTVILTAPAGHSMTVSSFESVPSVNGQLGDNGELVLSVGGSLDVGAAQEPAYYSGQMHVSVSYN